ncbi:unnamed protein product [Brassica oleracea var. botrytis]
MFLSLMEFENILSGRSNTSFLIDVVGASYWRATNPPMQREKRKKIIFTLRDMK